MIYAVDRYQDVVKVKEKREYWIDGKTELFHYFDSEEEARAFVRQRADRLCAEAEAALKRAIARTKKCQRKFGFRLNSSDAAKEQ